jgi:hypothetical protein
MLIIALLYDSSYKTAHADAGTVLLYDLSYKSLMTAGHRHPKNEEAALLSQKKKPSNPLS